MPVTAENRISQVTGGAVDLECGTTTVTLGRQRQVDFSSLIFVDGASFVTLGDTSRRLSDLAGKRIGVLAGSATEPRLREVLQDRKIDASVVVLRDEREAVNALSVDQEFSALRHGDLDFSGYLQLEDGLFAELRSTIAKWDAGDAAFASSRFDPAGPLERLVEGAPYNRSFRLTPAQVVGGALLVHGLTDSPYSMKALAETLHAQGFEVTVLRLPGHGTLPSMMVEMAARDWTAAVRVAARDVAGRIPTGQPFYIGGYSTGGTLALQYALHALEDPAQQRPDRVLLISPAVALTPVADLAEIIDLLSIVPVPLLEKVRWQQIVAEFDPYKFNSFPVNAARHVNRSTWSLRRALAQAEDSGASPSWRRC